MDGFKYPISLRTDYENILSDKRIFFCCYQINTTSMKPFLQYTLWKYPKSNNEYSDLFIFPFCKASSNFKKSIEQLKKSLHKENAILKGFLSNEDGYFVFLKDKLSKNKLKIKYRKKQKWWVTISEICNYKHVLKFPIHKSVYNIFFQNPKLIYLLDKNDKEIEIPYIGYYGNLAKFLPMEAVFGMRKARKALFGPFYYFGSYNSAFRYAIWTRNYKTLEIMGKQISDKEGKYLEDGGILRTALFLGKSKVLLNHESDKEGDINKKNDSILANLMDSNANWSKSHDSIITGRSPLINNYPFRQNIGYTVRKFKQQHILSIHLVDPKKSPRTWDPLHKNFYIK